MAQRLRRTAPFACAGQGNRYLHRDRYRGSATETWASVAGDRRPTDGRHGSGGRFIRCGQDVFAAGGQVRARDEEGRSPPDAFYGSRKGGDGGGRTGR